MKARFCKESGFFFYLLDWIFTRCREKNGFEDSQSQLERLVSSTPHRLKTLSFAAISFVPGTPAR